jgi:hypothetical protein
MPGNIINLTPTDVLAWPKPNYDNPVRRTWMPIFSGLTFAAATLMVATRFWLRIRGHAGKLGLDDVSTARGLNPLDGQQLTMLRRSSSQAGWLQSCSQL